MPLFIRGHFSVHTLCILSTSLSSSSLLLALQVKLDFCDLGRVINGRPEDPIHLRPFENAFTRAKVLASVTKLGLAPVNLKLALSHPRVRDDSLDGSAAMEEHKIHARHAASLITLAAAGIDAAALAVPPPSNAPPRRMVDGPSSAEQQYKSLKNAGTSAGAIFFSVGAKPFNCPLITSVASDRIAEKDAAEAIKNLSASGDFLSLQGRCKDIMQWVHEEEADFADLLQAERKELVSYVFKAQAKSGVTEHNHNKESTISFLDSLPSGEIDTLLLDPPCLKGDGRVAKGISAEPPLLALTAQSPLLTLTAEPQDPYLKVFDPLLFKLGYPDLKALSLPPWAEDMCKEGSSQSEKMIGLDLLFKWSAGQGGWARGRITALADKNDEVGGEKANFKVFYPSDDETADHRLMICAYAVTDKSPNQSWVFLKEVLALEK